MNRIVEFFRGLWEGLMLFVGLTGAALLVILAVTSPAWVPALCIIAVLWAIKAFFL